MIGPQTKRITAAIMCDDMPTEDELRSRIVPALLASLERNMRGASTVEKLPIPDGMSTSFYVGDIRVVCFYQRPGCMLEEGYHVRADALVDAHSEQVQ